MLKRIWSKIFSAEKKEDGSVPWKRVARIMVEIILVIVDILIDRKKPKEGCN
jgi:hypothetical protein